MKQAQILLPAFALLFYLQGCGRPQGAAGDGIEVKCIVRALDPERPAVTLVHEAVPDHFKDGTRVFLVEDAKLLDGIKVGDQVQVRLKKGASGYTVTRLEKH